MPHNIKDRLIRCYFSSRKSKVFLPIGFVHKDDTNSRMVDKEDTPQDSSGSLPNSPGGIKTAQSHLQNLTSEIKVSSKHGTQYQPPPDSLAM